MTHICVGNLTTIGSDNGLSPAQRQAIIWTNAGILLIWPLGTTFSEMSIEIHTFSFQKMHLKMLAILSGSQCVNGLVSDRHQVMVCCPTTPNINLNQSCQIISEFLWYSPQGNFTGNTIISILDMSLKIMNWRWQPNIPGANGLMQTKWNSYSSTSTREYRQVSNIRRTLVGH